jgi:hypothetical protein
MIILEILGSVVLLIAIVGALGFLGAGLNATY